MALRLVRRFSKDRRNEIRGALARYQEIGLSKEILEKFRNNSSIEDMTICAELLEAPGGLKERRIKGQKQKDLWVTYSTPDKSLDLELAYACGFLNSWTQQSIDAVATIRLLALVASVSAEDAASSIKICAQRWGASKYLCYKVAFLKSLGSSDENLKSELNEIDQILGHGESPALQYSALENVLPNISIFSIARRHTNTLRSKVGTNYRRSQSLNNLVATPVSEKDAAAFLHRAIQTSLLDTVHALWVLTNLKTKFPCVTEVLESTLQGELYDALTSAQRDIAGLSLPNLLQKEPKLAEKNGPTSLQLYRMSAAFLEYPTLCEFRNDIDCVIGLRLISSLTQRSTDWPAENFDDISVLRRPDSLFDMDLHNKTGVKLDLFYRTYLFLRLIQDPINLSLLSENDFKFVFNNTSELDSLLLEQELESMHLNASDNTRALVSVLALALYRGRSSDPDVDFDYRVKLESFIIDEFEGKIVAFIKSLTDSSPGVANYLAMSLNQTTLQKMYKLIQSSQQASLVRRDILNVVGFALNRIEYIIEAEAIETRNKVATLKQYFDASRMYVDSIAMRDWLEANPSAYTQEYKELLPKLVARLAAIANIPDKATGKVKQIQFLEVSSTVDHLVQQIAKEAFKEFCTNTEFGIESYLGRRIRHNTLHGVMTDPVDGVLLNPVFRPIIARTRFGDALGIWQSNYNNYIERIRKEFLQFRDSGKPNALFDPVLDLTDPTTRRSLSQLSKSSEVSGSEMLPDLVIAFCWQQIGPQLDFASRQIKVKMAGDVKQSLEDILGDFRGPEEQRVFSELDEAIDGVFSKVASWFRLPDSGFIPATIRALCDIIDIEFGREDSPTIVTGDSLETQYYGISVHRLYDCLAVLLQNAVKHGEFQSPITVNVEAEDLPNTNLQRVRISVLSKVDPDEVESGVERINAALLSTETGKDMVTEGYSGLKKVKYITKLNEGHHTVEATSVGDELELRFTLKVEVANERDDDETSIVS